MKPPNSRFFQAKIKSEGKMHFGTSIAFELGTPVSSGSFLASACPLMREVSLGLTPEPTGIFVEYGGHWKGDHRFVKPTALKKDRNIVPALRSTKQAVSDCDVY